MVAHMVSDGEESIASEAIPELVLILSVCQDPLVTEIDHSRHSSLIAEVVMNQVCLQIWLG